MIRHLQHSGIDKAWWDHQLLQCANRMWYAQSWVLDIMAPHWEALVDDGAIAIMPLTWRRKYGIRYLYQPYGMQQQGVFAAHYTDPLGGMFLQAIPGVFKYCDIVLNESMSPIPLKGSEFLELDQQLLPLEGDIGSIRAGYSSNVRRNLKKTPRPGIVDDIGAAEFKRLFVATTAARFNSGTPADHEMMEALITEALRRGQCRVFGIREGDVVLAAAAFMIWEGRVILYKSAADERALQVNGMFHIVDHVIAMHAGTGMLLDFAGSSTPSVARFNAGFGAQRKGYFRLRRNDLPFPFRLFKK